MAQRGGIGLLTKRDEGGAPFFDKMAQGLQSSAISRRKAIKLGGSALVASTLPGLSPSRAEALRTVALKLYWSLNREDNFTTATKQGKMTPNRLVINSSASRVMSIVAAHN